MKRRTNARVLVSALGLGLMASACSTLPTVKTDASASFNAHGRLSVHYRDLESGKEDTVFGRFDWVEHGDTVDLSLLDPLGQGVATVHAAPGAAELKLADGRHFEGASADLLTEQALGYALPVAGLQHWLQGRAGSPAGGPSDDADGGRTIKESGWTVHYPNATLPPRRIDLAYPGPGVALELRLALEDPDGS